MRKYRKFVNFLIFCIAIIAIVFGIYFYYKLHKIQSLSLSDNNKEKEISSLVSKVSRLYLFPEGEEPTIATVSDPLALKEQAFFTVSQKGDNVIIFSKIGKAVLYRPSIDKIIDIISIQSGTN